MTDIEVVTLKNGATEAKPLVEVTMMSLDMLLSTNPTSFIELVESCRDREHVIWGSSGERLVQLHLLESVDSDGHGHIHESIRNIVLSAVTGEGLGLTLGNPI